MRITKKLRNISLICFVVLIVISILAVFYLRSKDDFVNIKKKNCIIEKQVNYLLTGKIFPDIICFDTVGDSIRISEILKHKKILIYHYSEFHCNECCNIQIKILHKCFSGTPYTVIMLSSYFSQKHFNIHIKRNPRDFPSFRIMHKSLNWFIEDFGVPYLFVLNTNMTVSNFYIPDNNLPELYIKYICKVKKELSK